MEGPIEISNIILLISLRTNNYGLTILEILDQLIIAEKLAYFLVTVIQQLLKLRDLKSRIPTNLKSIIHFFSIFKFLILETR